MLEEFVDSIKVTLSMLYDALISQLAVTYLFTGILSLW